MPHKFRYAQQATVELPGGLIALRTIPGDTAVDAFGRMRVSNPRTIFDSKQLYDDAPTFWDDQEETGSGTTSSHSINAATTTIGVAANTAGKRTRQTFMRFNYQPGKSQLIYMTSILTPEAGGTGIVRGIGYYDDDNGVYFEDNEGTINVVIRSKVSGSVVNTRIAQSSWNLDTMDGNGPSQIVLDLSKIQIFIIDLQWLASGRVRFGFDIAGQIYYCHEALHANVIDTIYMSTANLPLRYQIENDGNGGAATLHHTCTSVISEGGIEENGTLRSKSTGGTSVAAATAGTLYAIIGLRLKSAVISCSVSTISSSLISKAANADFEWILIFNPTVAGTFTYSDESNSCVQTAIGATANVVTGGEVIAGGWSKGGGAGVSEAVFSARRLGAAIDGTVDELILCGRALSNNVNFNGSMTWRELA